MESQTIQYFKEQGYSENDILYNTICIKCSNPVLKEKIGNTDVENEYPFYCPTCDENMYSFEVYTKEIVI
jgi:rubrerythrin